MARRSGLANGQLIGATITGDKEIVEILEKIMPRESKNLLRSTVHGIAIEIKNNAKKLAPKGESGRLKKGIYARREKMRGGRPTSTVRFRDYAFYWRFVEYGTRKNQNPRGKGFFKAAKLQVMSNIEQITRKQFQKKLDKRIAAVLRRQAKARGKI